MKLTITLTLSLLTITLGLGAAVAHTPNPNGFCDNVGDESLAIAVDDETSLPASVGVDGVATVYLTGDVEEPTASLWLESNDHPGLQTHGHVCRTQTTGDTTIDPDTLLL